LLLGRVGILAQRGKQAGELSLGYMRRLEIARALALDPVLVLLDEPCAGFSQDAVQDFMEIICQLKEQGTTIMIVEHNMSIAIQDTSQNLCRNEEIVKAYLGE
jgi:ABC-type branched-subunit amino acid transport system ATPase component